MSSLPLRREECLHGLFLLIFSVWEQLLSVKLIEEERQVSDRQSSSDRLIDERSHALWAALKYTHYDQMKGHASLSRETVAAKPNAGIAM